MTESVRRWTALGAALVAPLWLTCGPSVVPPPPPRSLPAGVSPPVRILDERVTLAGYGRTTCTHQTPASANGDRWCAFTVVGQTAGLSELWVINVTRAVSGAVPRCDGSDAGCLRLTQSLPVPSASFFDGDTLIYHPDPVSSPLQDFLGPIHVWRPGWSRGRQISSGRGFICIGQEHSAAAACFDDPGGDPAKRDSGQVSAGYLNDEAGGPLPSLGRWPLRSENDTTWTAGFSPDGATFILASADAIGAKQTFRVVGTAEAGQAPLTAVIDDAEYWQVSNDSKQVYFLRGLPVKADLFIADFPSGQAERLIESGILSFSLIGKRREDQALGFVKDLGATKGEFKLLRDRSLATPKSIFTYEDILDGATVSPDLRYTVWMDFAFRGVVIRNDDLTTCALDVGDEPPVFDAAFLDHTGLMFWKEIRTSESSQRDGFFSPPARCREKQRFATSVDFMVPVGDRGLIFTEGVERSVLKYVAVAPGGATLDDGGPVQIDEDVGAPVVFVGTDPLLLVFPRVGPSADTTGIFAFGPVPL